MRVLVTGGAGFIGSHFIQFLLEKDASKVVCLDSFNDYYDPSRKRANVKALRDEPRVEIIEADFCDTAGNRKLFAQHDISHVVHLGAYAGVRVSVEQPEVYQRTNVGGTLALLEAARSHSVERFLLISSSTVYGEGADIPFCEDGSLGVPASPYGATKRAAELLGLTYHSLHAVPVVCLRPFSVYGPRLRPDLALSIFTNAIYTGKPFPLFGDGSIRRDFTHVRDICRGLFAAMSAEKVVGETINLGHDSPVEMREIISRLEQTLGKDAVIQHQPERPEDLPATWANLEKARRLLDYQPRVTLDDGIPEFVDWFVRCHPR